MLKSVEREREKDICGKGENWKKAGSCLSPSVHYVFINKSSWRTKEAPWEGELLTSVDKLAWTDQVVVGNNRVLGSVKPQLTNPHGINKSEVGGVHSVRPLLRVFTIIPIINGAVFGPVQICQLLKPRPPTLQIVIIQVRLCCDRLEGTQWPSQWSSAFVSVDLNGVVWRCSRVTVSLCNSSLNEVIDINAVGCSMASTGPDGILKLRFDVLSWQETVGTIRVLNN